MGLASQEGFFSSPEGAPALKRQRFLTTQEDKRFKMAVNELPGNNDNGVEVTEGNRSSDDEEEALPLTFCTKEDLIKKLQGIHHLPRGDEGSHHQPLQTSRTTGINGAGNKQLVMVERSSEVALRKGGRRQRKAAVREKEEEAHLEEMQENVVVKNELLCKMEEEEVQFGTGGSKDKDKIFAKEGDEETLRQDSYEDNSTIENNSKQEDARNEGGVM